MDEQFTAIGAGIVRHALTTVGGGLAASGIIHGDAGVQSFVGASMVIVGVAWSWWQKYGQAKALAEVKKLVSVVDFKRKA